jgi:septal ring factor EnvC (AmiA/AmiB activator)
MVKKDKGYEKKHFYIITITSIISIIAIIVSVSVAWANGLNQTDRNSGEITKVEKKIEKMSDKVNECREMQLVLEETIGNIDKNLEEIKETQRTIVRKILKDE